MGVENHKNQLGFYLLMASTWPMANLKYLMPQLEDGESE